MRFLSKCLRYNVTIVCRYKAFLLLADYLISDQLTRCLIQFALSVQAQYLNRLTKSSGNQSVCKTINKHN